MEVDENEGDIGARLRPIFCSLGEITRADGSVLLCQVVTNVKVYFDYLVYFGTFPLIREIQLLPAVSLGQVR